MVVAQRVEEHQVEVSERHLVLVGAGVGASARLPMMAGFVPSAIKVLRRHDEAALAERLDSIAASCRSGDSCNLSTLVTALEVGRPNSEAWQVLREVIARVVTYPLDRKLVPGRGVSYRHFFKPPCWVHNRCDEYVGIYQALVSRLLAPNREFRKELPSSVICLNYDVLFELSVREIGGMVWYPGAGSVEDLPYAIAGVLPLCKPHGSVTWTNDGVILDPRQCVGGIASGNFDFDNVCIEPPTMRPLQPRPLLLAAEDYARTQLEQADRLTVIGYGFNVDDRYINRLLVEHLSRYAKIDVYDVVCREEMETRVLTVCPEWKSRLSCFDTGVLGFVCK
jgi:hypothetical protein